MPAARRHCESVLLEQMSHLSCDKVKATSRSANHDLLTMHIDLPSSYVVRTLLKTFTSSQFVSYIHQWGHFKSFFMMPFWKNNCKILLGIDTLWGIA
ncbi:hypothetical protein JNUCC1_03119 [Lentibacillus sp. JNUCC-1]|nr:hypothetical protein [Lentibacillus sp. JNUCC-1]